LTDERAAWRSFEEEEPAVTNEKGELREKKPKMKRGREVHSDA